MDEEQINKFKEIILGKRYNEELFVSLKNKQLFNDLLIAMNVKFEYSLTHCDLFNEDRCTFTIHTDLIHTYVALHEISIKLSNY